MRSRHARPKDDVFQRLLSAFSVLDGIVDQLGSELRSETDPRRPRRRDA